MAGMPACTSIEGKPASCLSSPGMKRVAPASTATLPAPEVCLGKNTPAWRALAYQLTYVPRLGMVLGISMKICSTG